MLPLFLFRQADKLIMQPNRGMCLDCVPKEKSLLMRNCDKNSKTQKWSIEHVDEKQMAKWDDDRFDFKKRKRKQ